MSEQDIERFGDRVRAIAQALPYPAAARSSTR